MKPAAFEMFRPQSLNEALRLLAEHQDTARVLAGGQSLVPLMNFRLATPAVLVDLNRVDSLAGIRADGAVLRIGAMTRQQRLIDDPLVAGHAPLLAAAARYIGHVQTRSRGTIGGSLVQADPSAELPAVFVALGAQLEIRSARGVRVASARGFFRDAMACDLAPDEILTEIVVPVASPRARVAFRELARRHGDFAIVAAAVQVDPPHIAIALAGLEPIPRLCTQLMGTIAASGFDRASFERGIARELSTATPNEDLQASADYRRALARVLLHDALAEVLS
jgi:CO/xanthine dehydrogenase FAD-binding subunit